MPDDCADGTSSGGPWSVLRRSWLYLEATQEEFARELDVTVGTLSGWENDHRRPFTAQRKRLHLAMKVGIKAPLAASRLDSRKEQ